MQLLSLSERKDLVPPADDTLKLSITGVGERDSARVSQMLKFFLSWYRPRLSIARLPARMLRSTHREFGD